MATQANPQTNIYETTIEDAALEKALEERESLKERRKALNGQFRESDKRAKDLIGALDLGAEAPVRVGRFVITLRSFEGREVSFETAPSTRLAIRPLS